MNRGILSGRKTYIVAAFTVLAAWAGFFVGEPVLGQDALTFADAIQMTVVAVLGATLRHGISSDTL